MKYNISFFLLIFITIILFSCQQQPEIIIDASDFGLTEGVDATPEIRNVLDVCKEKRATKLIIPKGKYTFYRDKAFEKYYNVANNDDGKMRVGFPVIDFENFEIDANGSEFIFHGHMLPIEVERSKNIKLTNFSIDWDKPFFFQGQVAAVHPEDNSFDLKVFEECDYEIWDDQLLFVEKHIDREYPWMFMPRDIRKNERWEQNLTWSIWFNPETKAPTYRGGKYALEIWNRKLNKRYTATEIEKGLIRIKDAVQNLPEVGWVLIVKGKKDKNRNRYSVAIHLNESENLSLYNVNVHHAAGMGLIAERCENIRLTKFNVILPENSDRLCTTTADATHFVTCKGDIIIDSCLFENMLDDAANVHGIYVRVTDAVNENTLGGMRIHAQQQGHHFAGVGDTVQLVASENLHAYETCIITAVNEINEEYLEVSFDKKVDDILLPGTVMENVSYQPNMYFINCTVRDNRARSILISTYGKVVIENNLFKTCTYSGIMMEQDIMFWHESGAVNDVLITKNRFENIGLDGWWGSLFSINPVVELKDKPVYFHHNIRIIDNEFHVINKQLLRAKCVDGLTFKDNKIIQSKDFPEGKHMPTFELKSCTNVTIEDNDFQWETPVTINQDLLSSAVKKDF